MEHPPQTATPSNGRCIRRQHHHHQRLPLSIIQSPQTTVCRLKTVIRRRRPKEGAFAAEMASDRQPLHRRETSKLSSHSEPLPKRRVCTEFGLYKFLTVFYGVSYFLVGLVALVIGVWIISIKQQFEAINSLLTGPSVMTILVSLSMVLTAAIGIVGGAKDKLQLLRSFLVIVVFTVIAQVIIGIVSYILRDKAVASIDSQMEFAVAEYLNLPDIRDAFDGVQQRFECCGLADVQSWNANANYSCPNPGSKFSCGVPDSCCAHMRYGCGLGVRANVTSSKKFVEVMRERDIYSRGCRSQFLGWIEYNLDVIGATSLAFSILHIIGIFFVYMMVVKLEDRQQLFKYRSRYYNNT